MCKVSQGGRAMSQAVPFAVGILFAAVTHQPAPAEKPNQVDPAEYAAAAYLVAVEKFGDETTSRKDILADFEFIAKTWPKAECGEEARKSVAVLRRMVE